MRVSVVLDVICLIGGGVLLYLGTDRMEIAVGAMTLAVFIKPGPGKKEE